MPKSKQGPALFEVFDKGRLSEAQPRVDNLEGLSRRTPARESASAFKATLSSLARSMGGGSEREEAEVKQASSMDIEDGRIHVSLSSRGAGLAAFALLLLLAGSFLGGRWYGWQGGFADGKLKAHESIQGEALSDIAKARESRPAKGLFEGIGVSPVAKTKGVEKAPPQRLPRPATSLVAVSRAPAAWVTGNNYVVVQNFRGSARQDAIRTQEYLAQHGVETTIVGSSKRGFRLFTTKGFNHDDETQHKLSKMYLRKIRTIGKAYFKSGCGYRLEGYFQKLTTDTW